MDIISAIKNGDLSSVKDLVEKGANVNKCDRNLKTPLHYTAEKGNFEIFQYVLVEGADEKQTDEDGRRTLHYAAKGGNLEIVKYLIEIGANEKQTDLYGKATLHYAAEGGNLEIVKYLIEKGGDVNETPPSGTTTLHYAASGGNIELVKYLDEKVVNGMLPDKYGMTVLHYAAQGGNLEIVKYLIVKGTDVNYGKTALLYAAEKGNLEIVKYLIERGANVKQTDPYRMTALHHAARSGNLETVKYLIEKGVNVKQTGPHGKTALHYAARRANLEIVKYLIEKRADVRKTAEFENTTLHYAAQSGNLELVKYIVEKGARVNQATLYGETSLHCAARGGYLELVKYLVANGARIKQTDECGMNSFHYAAQRGKLEVVKYLVDKGADVNQTTRSGNTCTLYSAVQSGYLELVKYLIEKGANMNKTKFVNIKVHYAAGKCKIEIVKYPFGSYRNLLTTLAQQGNVSMLRILEPKLDSQEKSLSISVTNHKKDRFVTILTNNRENIILCRRMIQELYPSMSLKVVDNIISQLDFIHERCDEIFPLIENASDLDSLYKGNAASVSVSHLLGNYFIINYLKIQDEILGKGAFGVVRLGCSSFIEVVYVAVKCIDNSEHNVNMELLTKETEILSKMNHPNLVQFFGHKVTFDYENKSEIIYLVTELCKGDCKDYFIDNGKANNCNPPTSVHYEKSIQQYLRFALQLLSGVSYIHSQECIHKDLKLENILISNDNMIKIADFGLADFLKEGDIEKTNRFKGTLVYSAPEVLSMPRRYSSKSDMFSVSLLLLEMYQGQLYYKTKPFVKAKKEDLFANVKALFKRGVRPILQNASGRDEEAIILRTIAECWSQSPKDRLSAEGIKHSLQRVLENICLRNPNLEVINVEGKHEDVDASDRNCLMGHLSQALSDSKCVVPMSGLFKFSNDSKNVPSFSVSKSNLN